MATDLALYVLADPLHASLLLASAPGSGFDDDHYVSGVDFRFRGDDARKAEMLDSARARDVRVRPMLDELRRRAVETLSAIPEGAKVRDTGILVSALPGHKLKAMAIADRGLIEAGAGARDDGDEVLSRILAERYLHRAFVVDLEAYDFLLRYALSVGTDPEPLQRALDAGLGRVATVLAE